MMVWLLWCDGKLLGIYDNEQLCHKQFNLLSANMNYYKFEIDFRDLNVEYEV